MGKKTKRETALVTGANGFLGKHLVKALEAKNIEIIKIPHADLLDILLIQDHLWKIAPDYIYHLAAYGNMYDQKNEAETIVSNYIMTWNLLRATKDRPYKSFVFVSSSSVNLPIETFYSATKAGAERLCQAYATQYKKPISIVRPFSIYGPGEADFRFIPTVFRSCMTAEPMTLDPDPVHDWVYVEDFVQYLTSDLDLGISEYGTSSGKSNQEVVDYIEEITGRKANIKEKKRLRSFDNKLWIAKKMGLYTVMRHPLEVGLRKYYESIQETV